MSKASSDIDHWRGVCNLDNGAHVYMSARSVLSLRSGVVAKQCSARSPSGESADNSPVLEVCSEDSDRNLYEYERVHGCVVSPCDMVVLAVHREYRGRPRGRRLRSEVFEGITLAQKRSLAATRKALSFMMMAATRREALLLSMW